MQSAAFISADTASLGRDASYNGYTASYLNSPMTPMTMLAGEIEGITLAQPRKLFSQHGNRSLSRNLSQDFKASTAGASGMPTQDLMGYRPDHDSTFHPKKPNFHPNSPTTHIRPKKPARLFNRHSSVNPQLDSNFAISSLAAANTASQSRLPLPCRLFESPTVTPMVVDEAPKMKSDNNMMAADTSAAAAENVKKRSKLPNFIQRATRTQWGRNDTVDTSFKATPLKPKDKNIPPFFRLGQVEDKADSQPESPTAARSKLKRRSLNIMSPVDGSMQIELVPVGRSLTGSLMSPTPSELSQCPAALTLSAPSSKLPPCKMRKINSDINLGQRISGGLKVPSAVRVHSNITPAPSICPAAQAMVNPFAGMKPRAFSCATTSAEEEYYLPFIETGKDAIKRIDADTMVQLLKGEFDHKIDKYYVIDCRFPYEFEGGHVPNAINVNTTKHLEDLFFKEPMTHQRVAIIFHCEFSSQRAPRMALHLRSFDRTLNFANYPRLHYPNLYILNGGYKEFFTRHQQHCVPQTYLPMHDKNYEKELKSAMARYKREFHRTKSSSDALTKSGFLDNQ